MNKNPNNFFAAAKRTILAALAVLFVFTGAVLADNINLDMEGTTATIPKGNTVTRKIYHIPFGIPGRLNLRLKWHAVNPIPNTFNPLVIKLTHGNSTVIQATSCYSIHSNRPNKCQFLNRNISPAEAERSGDWILTITNNSNQEVIGFNIEKESADWNPLVPGFRSFYTPNCPNTVRLDMEGTTLTIAKGNTQERRIFYIGAANGRVRLRMKWHAVNLIPNTFNPLKVDVMYGNQVVTSNTCYSVHSNQPNKCAFDFDSGNRPANGWKLRVTNNSNQEVIGFNIEKENADWNPLVPNFNSTYRAYCQ